MNLDPHNESFILIKFMGLHSAVFELFPANVSPAQMMMVGQLLVEQARGMMAKEHDKALIREVLNESKTEDRPDILVAQGRVLKP